MVGPTPLAPTYVYTDKPRMQRLYSVQGINSQVSERDFAGDTDDAINDCIYETTTTFDSYCATYYASSDMVNSNWVVTRATWYACWLLSQRKGSTDRFWKRVEQIIDELEKIRIGLLTIPDIPISANFVPSMSNVFIDVYSNQNKIKVHPFISTGGVGSLQQVSWLDSINSWF